MLGQCGDCQAWINPEIGAEHRTIANQQVLIAEDPVLYVHHAALRRVRHRTAAHAVGRGRDVEQDLGQKGGRYATERFCALFGKRVRLWNEGRDGAAFAGELFR